MIHDWTEKCVQIEIWLQNNATTEVVPVDVAAVSAEFDCERILLEKKLAEVTEWTTVFWDNTAATSADDPLLTTTQWDSVAYLGSSEIPAIQN